MKLSKVSVRLSDIEELKEFLHKQKKVKAVKQIQKDVRRVKRSFLDKHRLLIVKLRYAPDQTTKIRTWTEISNLTGIGYTTLIEMIRSFHVNGNCEKRRYSTGRPPWPIPPTVEAYIKENLEKNAFQSSRYWCS